MSGRNRFSLLLLLAFATVAQAQALPDVGEAELKDVKLLLLDSRQVARGSLTAKSAKKERDGRVTVTGTLLRYERADRALELEAEKLVYTPGAGEFEAPSGFTARLPDGGLLAVPKGTAAVAAGDKLSLNARCEGDVRLRVGPEGKAPLDVHVDDPEVAITFDERGRAETLFASGKRGATLLASFARLPSLGGARDAAVLTLSCSSAVRLEMGLEGATLVLGGRVRGSLQQQRTFNLACNQLRLKTRLVKGALEPHELDADGSARIAADEFEASAARIVLVEDVKSRTATLTRDARARTWHNVELLEVEARDSATLTASGNDDTLAELDVVLKGSARLFAGGQRLDDKGERKADWQIQGQHVACSRAPLLPWVAAPAHVYTFEITGNGFAPLLLLAGRGEQAEQALSAYGQSAHGTLVLADQPHDALVGDVEIAGENTFVTALGPFHLVRDLRKALGLRALEDEGQAASEPGRLVVRAAETARFRLTRSGGTISALFAQARSNVEVRQEPALRNDSELCTLSGDFVELEVSASKIGSALVEPGDGEVRATIGYDIVQCSRFAIAGSGDEQAAALGPPGRIVARDTRTLAYLHGALTHLDTKGASQHPDAAWIVFAQASSVTASAHKQVFAFAKARLVFVRGDFVKPRAGPGAFLDLDELEDSDVQLLYEARADRLQGSVELDGKPEEIRTLRFSLELAGSPLLRSNTDGLLAVANGPIHIEAAEEVHPAGEDERRTYLLGTALKLGEDAEIRFDQAARFFDDPGRLAGFIYGGVWVLSANEGLTVQIAPASPRVQALQGTLANMGRAAPDWGTFLDRLGAFETLLAQLPPEVDIGPDAERVKRARELLREARVSLRAALDHLWQGRDETSARLRQAALSCEAKAFGLLGPDILVTTRGASSVELHSGTAGVTPILISLSNLDLAFSALREITRLSASGPVRVTRGRYVISGRQVSRGADGALTLDGARLTLPADIGFEIEGVDKVIARSTDVLAARIRISGRRLRIKATLLQPSEKK